MTENDNSKVDVLSKVSRDNHLNTFWFYEGKPELENNITKALINTIDSLEKGDKTKIIEDLCGIGLDEEGVTIDFYLQTSPDKERIKKIDEKNRFLIAFSPTGKAWGFEGIATGDYDAIRERIKESLELSNSYDNDEQIQNEIESEVKNTEKIIKGLGSSRPDAWLIARDNQENECCIAFENKLYDLNPYQLNNHCKKALMLKEPYSDKIIYKKYSEIIDCMNGVDSYLAGEYIRYMYLLGYVNIDNLSELCNADEKLKNKYAKEKCWKILEKIQERYNRTNKEAHNTDKEALKSVRHNGVIINDTYLKEIDLSYKDNVFELGLYFATTQSKGKIFYSNCSVKNLKKNLKELNASEYLLLFHFQFTGFGQAFEEGKKYMIKGDSCKLEKYIVFWQRNLDIIRQTDATDREKIIEIMDGKGFFNKKGCEELKKKSHDYKSDGGSDKLNLAPEFGIAFKWNFEDAAKLDESDLFVKTIIDKINDTYRCFFPNMTLI